MLYITNIIEEGKYGGPQVYIILLTKALIGQVNNTVVMPKENSAEFQKKCAIYGIPFKAFNMSRITKEWKVALRYLLFSPVEIIRLILYFKSMDFDIIYACGGSWQYKGLIAGKLSKKKVIWHLNDTYMPYLFRKLFSLFSHFADGFIYASERSKTYYQPLTKTNKPKFVIPAPVDIKHFDPTLTFVGDEDLINSWADKIVIGTVANVNPIKGLELFIRSASLLNKKQKENLIFVVIGATYPRQDEYLRKLITLYDTLQIKNIHFVGLRQDIRPLLKRFDVYVCSSLAESSPISVWEAMAMEKPVVSTDVGDVPVYIENGLNGYIVDVGDSEAMANRIGSLLQDNEKRAVFGQRARRVAVQELDVSKCAARHLDAYRAIMQ